MLIFRHARRIGYALEGIWYALRHDFGYKWEVYGGLAFVLALFYMLQPFSYVELLIVSLGWCLILVTELQNSAIEIALDHLHPERHESIKRCKDMAAGAVLTAACFLGVTTLTLGCVRFVL